MIPRRIYSPIGIDVTTRCIRAAQLVRRGRGPWKLHAAITVPRENAPTDSNWTPPTEAEHERLVGVLQRRAFEGSDVVLAVPADRMIEAVIELPPRSSGAPLTELAATELGRVHKIEAGTLQVAYWEVPPPARSAGNAVEYMVAGCTEQAALELIDPFERVGLIVRALEVRALSLQRACASTLGAKGTIDAILCLGWNHTTLLFVVDGIVTFQRTLDGVDGKSLSVGAAQKLRVAPSSVIAMILRNAECSIASGTPSRREMEREITGSIVAHVEDIANQFNLSCSYIARRYPDRAVASVIVAGEFGALPGLAERLEKSNLKSRRFCVSDAVDVGDVCDPASIGTEFTATLGLAMRPMRGAA